MAGQFLNSVFLRLKHILKYSKHGRACCIVLNKMGNSIPFDCGSWFLVSIVYSFLTCLLLDQLNWTFHAKPHSPLPFIIIPNETSEKEPVDIGGEPVWGGT